MNKSKFQKLTLTMLMIFCITTISAFALPKSVIPIGKTIGIKMFAEGAVVVKLSSVETAEGKICPAKKAGLKEGDVIVSVDGQSISSNEELQNVMKDAAANEIKVTFKRDSKEQTVALQPVQSVSDGTYRIGVLVRDSMAGIGTVTFIDPETGAYGSLGHGICDLETGQLMPLRSGTVMNSKVSGVIKGKSGTPGELEGEFDFSRDIGTVEQNTITGIYGHFNDDSFYANSATIPVADPSEVKEGKIEILANVDGTETKTYTAEITKLFPENDSQGRSFMIKITDPTLLEKTGGIVQGMSGSPILQNGKIIGAVTHVLVNDPTRGYGIYINKMLEDIQKIA